MFRANPDNRRNCTFTNNAGVTQILAEHHVKHSQMTIFMVIKALISEMHSAAVDIRKIRLSSLILLCFLVSVMKIHGQDCPANIGFERGDFEHWVCETGNISTSGNISLDITPPVADRHEIIKATSVLITDPYGDFPVNSPNGSGYSVRLGSTETGTMADRVSYTFTVPANQQEYSIIYNYAVVFFNPPNGHADFEQPKFTARAFDVSANQYIDCGSFDFVSSSGLPGFQQSKVDRDIFFKPWAPITLNLNGFAGKTIRLELTVNGCTKNNGRHFGYAYIDVNENCESPISGNVLCDPGSPITLKAPGGFKEYHWYNTADLTKELGRNNTLTISPAPPVNTRYAVKIVPFPGLGCAATLYTVTSQGEVLSTFKVEETLQVCYPESVDLTSAVSGNDTSLKYTYFTDAAATTYVRVPDAVVEEGIYYIKATNASGCSLIKPVHVKINQVKLIITDPLPACFPGSVDLTTQSITTGSDDQLIYTYWQDLNARVPLNNPEQLETSGTYYIKAVNTFGCFTIKPVNVLIADLITHNQTSCESVNLTTSRVTQGSSPGFVYTYWKDNVASIPLQNPDSVKFSGTYYIKGTNSGCFKIMPVDVIVHQLPVGVFINPAPVTYPNTVDLAIANANELTYTYWKDPKASIPLLNPGTIAESGTYYLKTTTIEGCSVIFPLTVIINDPPLPKVITSNTFTPNSDGINDLFKLSIEGEVRVNYLKIYNRWGQLIFSTSQINTFWDGTLNGKMQSAGTYYWMLDGIDDFRKQKVRQSGSITLIR